MFENHHQPIIDYRTFATTRALREQRTTSQLPGREEVRQCVFRLPVLRGLRQPHVCHEPQRFERRLHLRHLPPPGPFRVQLSHHIRVDKLDELLKVYVRQGAWSNSACHAGSN